MTQYEIDYTLCECELPALLHFVEQVLEPGLAIAIIKAPAVCLTMVRACDSVEGQEFYLGEVLITECEVMVNNTAGQGICTGDEPAKSYSLAVIDALLSGHHSLSAVILEFLEKEKVKISAREQKDFNYILSSEVDFKTMQQD